jgi:hypothetical protein
MPLDWTFTRHVSPRVGHRRREVVRCPFPGLTPLSETHPEVH